LLRILPSKAQSLAFFGRFSEHFRQVLDRACEFGYDGCCRWMLSQTTTGLRTNGGHKMNASHSGQTGITRDDVQLLTLSQVAERLQVSLSDVRRKIRAGALPSVRLGPRQVRVLAADLQAYVESRRRPLCGGGEAAQ
jgi:excisionase family DNA binding protein